MGEHGLAGGYADQRVIVTWQGELFPATADSMKPTAVSIYQPLHDVLDRRSMFSPARGVALEVALTAVQRTVEL